MAVSGCLYSKLCLSSINKVEKMILDSSPSLSLDGQRILQLLDVSKKTNYKCMSSFLQSQSTICASDCENYATKQFNSLEKCVEFNEDYKEVDMISKFIVT